MKALLILTSIVVLASGLDADFPVLDDRIINIVNSDPSRTWFAGRNAMFEGMTLADARETFLRGALPITKENWPRRGDEEIPLSDTEESDSRETWPQCADLIGHIFNQGQCGSDWAFVATGIAADRFCTESAGETHVELSAQDLMSCDDSSFGCNGGYQDQAMKFLVETGVRSAACIPYDSGSGRVEPCRDSCVDPNEDDTRYKLLEPYECSGEASMKHEIENYGPIDVIFDVYQDFFTYISGVYHHTSGAKAGGHVVKIIGFGIEDGEPYWQVANSWGEAFGMDGYFRIRRGNDECRIESHCMAAHPALG